MIRAGHIVDFEGRDTYLQHESGMPNLGRLAIPMLFVHGAENKCWDPVSTQITVDLLGERNGTALYDRQLVPGYGHIDCIFGKDAHRDVYPRFVEHFDRT
jgi:cholesterol oxidase